MEVAQARLTCAMAAARGKPRLVADPSIGVGDLLECTEAWLDELNHNRLHSAIKPPAQTTWKTAPDPGWLLSLNSLWSRLLRLAPNGMIPSKKNRQSLERLQDARNVNQGKMDKQTFADQVDEYMRIGLAQLRSLKQSELQKSRAFRKVTKEEQQQLEEVLSLLTEFEEEPQSLALVTASGEPVQGREDSQDSTAEASVSKETEILQLKMEKLEPSEIFAQVLKRPCLATSSESPVKFSSPREKRMVDSPSSFAGFLSGIMEMGAYDQKEYQLLQESANQEPINTGHTSQLQRANKVLKAQEEEQEEDVAARAKTERKASKGKGRGKGRGKGQKKLPVAKGQKGKVLKRPSSRSLSLEASVCQDAPKKVKKKMSHKRKLKKKRRQKRTASDQHQSEPPEAEEPPPEEATPAPAPELPAPRPEYPNTPDGFDPYVTRAVNRKRHTSRAWHAGAVEAKNEGLEGEAFYQRAREHSQRASEEFERLWPTPAAAAADAADAADVD